MEITAQAKFIRMSPKKVRLVAALVRGRDAQEAITRAKFSNRLASSPIIKLINSAMANAKESFEIEKDNLKVKSIIINEGPALKRWMPKAMGRATPIKERSSHITLVLEEKVPTAKKAVKKQDTKDDLIKVGNVDEIKGFDEETKGDEAGKGSGNGKKSGASKKSFGSKLFNRKSGSK